MKRRQVCQFLVLPPHILEVVKTGMAGQAVSVLSHDLACVHSLSHGHVAAVVGTMRSSGLTGV